jgi:hypothetical protein
MMILKILFVAVLCIPLVYLSILLLTKLMDQVIGRK